MALEHRAPLPRPQCLSPVGMGTLWGSKGASQLSSAVPSRIFGAQGALHRGVLGLLCRAGTKGPTGTSPICATTLKTPRLRWDTRGGAVPTAWGARSQPHHGQRKRRFPFCCPGVAVSATLAGVPCPSPIPQLLPSTPQPQLSPSCSLQTPRAAHVEAAGSPRGRRRILFPNPATWPDFPRRSPFHHKPQLYHEPKIAARPFLEPSRPLRLGTGGRARPWSFEVLPEVPPLSPRSPSTEEVRQTRAQNQDQTRGAFVRDLARGGGGRNFRRAGVHAWETGSFHQIAAPVCRRKSVPQPRYRRDHLCPGADCSRQPFPIFFWGGFQ